MKQQNRGVTLVELLITLVVAAVLLAIAVPAMETVTVNSRSYNVANQIYQDLLYARQLAASYQNRVTLCHLGSEGCDGNWEQGYTIFLDNDDSQSWTSGDERLQSRDGIASSDTLRFNANEILFYADGRSSNSGDFIFCPERDNSEHSRTIRLSSSGMVQNLGISGNCL